MLSITVLDIVVIYTCFRLFYLGHRIPRGSWGFTLFFSRCELLGEVRAPQVGVSEKVDAFDRTVVTGRHSNQDLIWL